MQPQVGRSINVKHISATKKNAQVIATEVFSLAFLLSRNLIIKHRTIMFEDHTLQAAHTHTHTHIYIGFSKLYVFPEESSKFQCQSKTINVQNIYSNKPPLITRKFYA